ncbi:MAG: hypothetical protein KJZ69_13910 [Phycisphaerales bacterium]|nr:hypothetical protein [Phycisphaerales bacterium]
MAESKTDKEAAPAPVGRKSNLKVVLIVAAIMLIEAGVLIGVAMFTSAPAVKADSGFEAEQDASLNRVVEIPVVHDRFPNSKQGVLYLYDTQITARAKARHEKVIADFVAGNQALIKTTIAALWRNAEPRHFNEPLLSTLTRQAEEALKEIMPRDPKSGESLLDTILLEGVTPYRAGI